MNRLDPARGPANDCVLGEFTDRETLRFVREFAFPPAFVWETLTDAKQYTAWLWKCTVFEAKPGGRFSFDISGMPWHGQIRAFVPPHLLDLGRLRFELFERAGGCRLILTLKRPPTGWSPMALAGFMGWLGRLTRLIESVPQVQTEHFASDIWEAMWPAYERMLRHHVTGGAKAVYRLHFAPHETGLNGEAKSHLDALVALLRARVDLNVVIDGFGDDPGAPEQGVPLSAARMEAAAGHLRAAGIAPDRILTGFVLGNYHQLVPSETEAGRAFNRRVELRPTY